MARAVQDNYSIWRQRREWFIITSGCPTWSWRCVGFANACGKAGIPFQSLTSADAINAALIICCGIIFQWLIVGPFGTTKLPRQFCSLIQRTMIAFASLKSCAVNENDRQPITK